MNLLTSSSPRCPTSGAWKRVTCPAVVPRADLGLSGGLGGLALRASALLLTQARAPGVLLASRSGRVPRDREGQGLAERLSQLRSSSAAVLTLACDVGEAAREAGLSNPEIKVWVWLIIYAAPIPDPPPRPERAQLLGDVRRAVLALVVALRAGAVAPPADANGDRPVPRTLLTVVAWAMRAARERVVAAAATAAAAAEVIESHRGASPFRRPPY